MTAEEHRAAWERVGRFCGDRRFTVAFTQSLALEGDAYKTALYWQSRGVLLPTSDFGAALLANRCRHKNGVLSLRRSNVLGFDIDGEAGRALAREIAPEGMPPTVATRSGRLDGGTHLWYVLPDGAPKAKIQLAAEVTASADGYLLLAGSWHAAARAFYSFLPGHAPWEIEIAPFPSRLYKALIGRTRRDDTAARADDASPLGEGKRHPHLRRIAGAMRYAGAGEEAILAALQSENERRCVPPKDDAKLRELARWIVGFAPGDRHAR
jgi:hypothetical protein